MPLIALARGQVVLRPEPPVISRLWTPPPSKRTTHDADATRLQRALLATRPRNR